MYDAIKRILTF